MKKITLILTTILLLLLFSCEQERIYVYHPTLVQYRIIDFEENVIHDIVVVRNPNKFYTPAARLPEQYLTGTFLKEGGVFIEYYQNIDKYTILQVYGVDNKWIDLTFWPKDSDNWKNYTDDLSWYY